MNTHQASDFVLQSQLTQIILTYFAAIDDKQFSLDLFQALFAQNANIRRPSGPPVIGPAAIYASQEESFKRFRATQHVLTNLLYTQPEAGWQLRANMQAMHIWAPEQQDPTALETYFLAHSVLKASFTAEDEVWKIATLGVNVVWRTGSGMLAMLRTGKEN